jgi:hypothetical protein
MKPTGRMVALSAARSVGWIVGAMLLGVSLLSLDAMLNLFDWHPEFSEDVRISLIFVAAALFITWVTARRTGDVFSHYVALLVSICLLAFAIYTVWPEPMSASGFLFLRRTSTSPLWYRMGRSFVLVLPLWLWISLPLRLRRMRRRGKEPSEGHNLNANPLTEI